MQSAGERPAGVHDAVQALERASRTPAKQRTVKVSGLVDAICRHAFDHGLDAHHLRALVRLASRKSELDQTSVTTILKSLYPAGPVPADVVVTIVGALGQGKGKPSLGSQNGLVKWLTTVHEIIDDPKILSRLYGVLFGMLDMISIRTAVCHLLSLVTRRKHVKSFRIQQLLELSRGLGNEPALQGLLRIYRDYYPDIILTTTATTRNSFPPRPDDEWRKRLLAVQEASAAADEITAGQQSGFRVLRKGPKRSKLSAIPEVHTFRANETSVTLEEIDNVEDFVGKLERIEPPGQMVSFLTDPLLQKFVNLCPSPIILSRIDLWLSTCLEEEYDGMTSGAEPSTYLEELLHGVYRHTEYTNALLPVISTFLKAYIPIWDGVTAADAILGLLSYVELQPFADAYTIHFGPAEKALSSRGLQSYEKLLQFYTALLQHWTSQNARVQASQPASPTRYTNREIFEDLVAHVSTLSTSLLLSLSTTNSSPLISSILTFYELLSTLSKPFVLPIILPPPHLSYLLAQSAATTTLSRICGIYANYKNAFDRHPTPIPSYYPQTLTGPFNNCLRDLYNLLMGTKALQGVSDSPAFYCSPVLRESLNTYLADIDHEYAVGVAFGFSHSPLLASYSAAAWWVLEEAEIEKQGYDRTMVEWHQGPVTQHSLQALEKNRGVSVGLWDYKLHTMEWMADRGCGGIRDVLFATSAKLKK